MKIGLDFDGVLHDSCKYSHAAFCETLRDHKLNEIPMDLLREHFGSHWPSFFAATGVPERLHTVWKEEYQKRYDKQPVGELIPGTHELIDHIRTKHGNSGLVLITNELPERVERFFAANKLSNIDVRNAYAGKTKLLEEMGVTQYVGDTASDGLACIAAINKPRFIGIAHDASYNMPEALYTLKQAHPAHDIVIVKSLHQARDHL